MPISPNMPPQMQAQAGAQPSPAPAPQQPMGRDTPVQGAPQKGADLNSPIIRGLEAHLNTVPDEQKKFLADALGQAPQLIIPVLGIVNGPEVYDYFTALYNEYFGQQNPAQGGQPQAPAQQPSAGGVMSPMSQPQAPAQGVMNPQQQAKATPMPMA